METAQTYGYLAQPRYILDRARDIYDDDSHTAILLLHVCFNITKQTAREILQKKHDVACDTVGITISSQKP